MCELVTQGHSPKSALDIVLDEERDTKTSKRWESFMTVGLKNELENCEPFRAQVVRRTLN